MYKIFEKCMTCAKNLMHTKCSTAKINASNEIYFDVFDCYFLCVTVSLCEFVKRMKCVVFLSFIHFRTRFSSREDRAGSSPRMTRNASYSTATSGNSAGSIPRRDQARSEISYSAWSLDNLWAAFP